jgi:hypothetical protein
MTSPALPPIRFHPRPHLQPVPIAPGRTAWVVDDALVDAQALRDLAIAEAARFEAAPFNAYPGVEWRPGPAVDGPLAEFFAQHVRGRLGARRTKAMYSRLSLVTLPPSHLRPLQRLCHRDRFGTGPDEVVAACVLYLFDDPSLGGTGFYAPRRSLADIEADFRRWNAMDDAAFTAELGQPPGYLAASNDHFELLTTVPARWNRLVFYDGSGFHSSHVTDPSRLVADPARGRLTLNGFFVCRRAA